MEELRSRCHCTPRPASLKDLFRAICRDLSQTERLVRPGIVFDDEIAAQQRMRTQPDAHRNFGSGEGVRGSRLFLVKQRSERSRTERMWEPDRSQESKGVRGAKGSGERRGSGEPRGPWRIKRMEVPVFSFIRSLISHQHISHSHLHSLYFSRTHPSTPSHCRIR